MRKIMRRKLVMFLFLLLCGTPVAQSWAAAAKSGFDEKAVADFYKGKTVRIIVGFSAGGGYDAYSRVIGRHLHKHIPGNPNVLVDNMGGAGSILAANHINNVAPETLELASALRSHQSDEESLSRRQGKGVGRKCNEAIRHER
jgi:hypothetical protein